MKVEKNEFILVGLIIAYIAFFTHPPPSFVSLMLESPVGNAFFLLLILYITVYQTLIGGIFLGIAYLMSSSRFTEHLENAPQKLNNTTFIGGTTSRPSSRPFAGDQAGGNTKMPDINTVIDSKKEIIPVLSKDRAFPTSDPKPSGSKSFTYQPLADAGTPLFPAEETACVHLPNSNVGKNMAAAYAESKGTSKNMSARPIGTSDIPVPKDKMIPSPKPAGPMPFQPSKMIR